MPLKILITFVRRLKKNNKNINNNNKRWKLEKLKSNKLLKNKN